MVIGILTIDLFLGEATSLKGKRRVLKSLLDRMKSRFNISVAEVGRQNNWQYSTVGVSVVSNEQSHAHQTLSAVVRFIEVSGNVEIIDFETEIY
ncbi:MAG: DUF503 domain-containing protein [Bacillota bacterium]|jgi:uncharacterized protein YlxP (DUF503 family)